MRSIARDRRLFWVDEHRWAPMFYQLMFCLPQTLLGFKPNIHGVSSSNPVYWCAWVKTYDGQLSRSNWIGFQEAPKIFQYKINELCSEDFQSCFQISDRGWKGQRRFESVLDPWAICGIPTLAFKGQGARNIWNLFKVKVLREFKLNAGAVARHLFETYPRSNWGKDNLICQI